MDKEITDQWEKSMAKILALPSDRRKHFALLLVHLADCYDEDNDAAAVVLIHRDDKLVMFSAGATEFECSGMLDKANELVHAVVTADAPPKEMFN
jgi:hypothetical protein